MRKIYLFILFLALIESNVLFKAKSEELKDHPEDVLQQVTKKVLEKKVRLVEEVKSGEIMFKVKKSNLWLKKEGSLDKKKSDEFAEITLPGKLYNPPKEIMIIKKQDVDRSNIENAVASVFSATRSGDLNWISDNFTDNDKERIKTLFTDKKILEESTSDAQKIISIYITGQADYKDSVLVFIEEDYVNGKRVKESLACKKTEKGWKVTNEFSSDEAFDIVFGAVSSGKVSLK